MECRIDIFSLFWNKILKNTKKIASCVCVGVFFYGCFKVDTDRYVYQTCQPA